MTWRVNRGQFLLCIFCNILGNIINSSFYISDTVSQYYCLLKPQWKKQVMIVMKFYNGKNLLWMGDLGYINDGIIYYLTQFLACVLRSYTFIYKRDGQWLSTLAAFTEDSDSVPSTTWRPTTTWNSRSMGHSVLFWAPQVLHTWYTYIFTGKTVIHIK